MHTSQTSETKSEAIEWNKQTDKIWFEVNDAKVKWLSGTSRACPAKDKEHINLKFTTASRASAQQPFEAQYSTSHDQNLQIYARIIL